MFRVAGAGKPEHQLDCLGIGQAVVLAEGAPRIEAERECDCCSEGFLLSATDGPGLDEDVRRSLPVLVVGRHDGGVAGISEDVADHLPGSAMVGGGLAERRAQPFLGIGARPPTFGDWYSVLPNSET